MFYYYSLLVEFVGVEKENIFIINNGDIVDIKGGVVV